MIKKILLNGGLVIIIYLLCVYFFNTQKIIFPVFMMIAFVGSMFMSYKNVVASFIPLLVVWLIHLFSPDTKLNNVIIYIIFTPLTFLLGYYLKNKTLLLKAFYSVILVLVGIYGFINLWFVMENFDARKIESSPEMVFTNSNEKSRLDTIRNKVIVLDYWTTTCPGCFQKFPKFEELYLKF